VVGSGARSYGRAMTSKPLIPLLAVALLAGCGNERADRAGGEKPVKAKVLTMANAQYFPDELAAFREAVERVSEGRLRLKLINQYGAGREGNPEVNLIRDVSAGEADLGWAATRVFDELGVTAFNPLHAPMLIESYELEQRVLSDGLVDPMLESLGELGLRGVGVLPGPLRRPFGKRPLVALDDWAGASIGSSGGDQVGMALRAVGARRSLDFSGGDTDRIDGLDTHIAAVPPNHYQRTIPYLTGNVVLWARPLVVFAGPNVSADDLAVLQQAAEAAIPQVLELSRKLERDGLAQVCRSRLQVVAASPAQVEGLRAAFRPVYDRLERDAAASRAVARIRELAEGGGSVATVRCPEVASAPAGTIPPGTYRIVLTRDDVRNAGGKWAMVVSEDPDPRALKAKKWEIRIEFTEQGGFTIGPVLMSGERVVEMEATYSIYRDRLTLDSPTDGKLTMRVEVDGNQLIFSDVKPGPPPGIPDVFSIQPFVKID
jgi:TRAP-type transport system periplasmic protein